LFAQGLALEAAQAGCGLQGLAYGEASAGACSDAAVVGVAGPTAALHLGVAAGWWGAALTEAPDAKVRPPQQPRVSPHWTDDRFDI
jgi:hypothetical protein